MSWYNASLRTPLWFYSFFTAVFSCLLPTQSYAKSNGEYYKKYLLLGRFTEKICENYHSPSILHSDEMIGLNPLGFSKWKRGQVESHESCMCPSSAIKTRWKIQVSECTACCGPQKGRSSVPPLITPMERSIRLAMVFSFTVFQIMSPLITVSAAAASVILVLGRQCSLPFFLPPILYTTFSSPPPFPPHPAFFGLNLMKFKWLN